MKTWSKTATQNALEECPDWKFQRDRETKIGLKKCYFCSAVNSCPKLAYILLHQEDYTSSIWYNAVDHDYTPEKTNFGINEITKKQVEVLYKSSVNTATRIRLALRERFRQYLPKKFDVDPDSRTIFMFPFFLTGTTDLEKTFHAYTISICSTETRDDFEFIFTAPKKHLKNLYNYDFKPDILIAEGAEAITNGFMAAFNYKSIDDFTPIMCWAHVYRAIDTRTKSIKESTRSQIQADISSIQLSPSPSHFKLSCSLFFKKWSKKILSLMCSQLILNQYG